MAKRPDQSGSNNRLLYVGFVALGVLAIWIGVMLGNYLLNRVATTEEEKNPVNSSAVEIIPESQVIVPDEQTQTTSADMPDDTTTQIPQSLYRVRVGRYSGLSVAKKVEKELQALNLDTYVIGSGSGPYYVQVGAFGNKENADKLAQDLKAKGYDVYVVQ